MFCLDYGVDGLLNLFLSYRCERIPMHRTWLPGSILLAVLLKQALGQGFLDGLFRIDCGAQTPYYEDYTYWNTDDRYITTGDNIAIPLRNAFNVTQLNTLRCFKKQTRNCYTLPANPSQSYHVKASFYYGNYDGSSRPPTFGLEIEGIEWTDVMTSSTQAVYHEVIYMARRDNISVCLVRAKGKNGDPFINALETSPLSDMYDELNHDLTWFRKYRYSFGAEGSILGYPDDLYNRVWEANTPPDVKQVAVSSFFYNRVNEVPTTVLDHAVEAPSLNDSVNLQLALDETDQDSLYYMTFYFTSMHYDDENYTGKSSFDMDIENIGKSATIDTDYSSCTCWTLANIQMNATSTLSIKLRPNGNTSFPPAISAMEAFKASMASPSPPADEKKGQNLGLLVGLPIAGLVFGLAVLGLFVYCFVSRRPRLGPGGPVPGRPENFDPGKSSSQEEIDELLALHFANLQSHIVGHIIQ
ncbi:hypothetical protein MLD38_011610 [Melastoma candidum]|uniref:Uncharacterized protein n=1 Tax=Melastoma candidum TaxID=119954 RepID=A0ACB9R757_9MYRT|nr:hypothetical protein MLD38_011610 [Melastoma candidum]